MNIEPEKNQEQQSGNTANEGQESQRQHSSAFKEPGNRDQKSNTNVEDEAELEQERKEAMTERD
jgi:hypothetical protein